MIEYTKREVHYMQRDIINAIKERKIIAIVRGVEPKKLVPLAKALL